MSVSDLHTKVLGFLAQAVALEGHQSAVRIELTYSPQTGYRADPIKAWSAETDPEFFGNKSHVYTERLVAEILELAENHADSYGSGRHRFVLRVHQHMGGRQTHAFAILPSFDGSEDQAMTAIGDGSAGGALQPTNAGVITQFMRHTENLHRGNRDMMQGFITAMNHAMAQLREENMELRKQLAAKDNERMEWLNTIEAARSTEHQRQIEAQIVVGKEERKTHAAKKIVNLLPVAMSHWMGSGKSKGKPGLDKDGKPMAPPQPSPLAALAGKLIDSLSDEQKGQLGSTLSMEQQIAFVEIINVVENGDSILLPTMLNDLASGLAPAQMQALMSILGKDQLAIFVQIVKLAKAQATTDPVTPPKPESDNINGTETVNTEIAS